MMTQRDIALLREFLERFKRICPDADGKADPAALMNAGRASESAPRLQSKAKGCDDLVVVLLYLGTRRYTSYSPVVYFVDEWEIVQNRAVLLAL
jgi:hypothetical protein